MAKKVWAKDNCRYCGEKFKVNANMKSRAYACSKKQCQKDASAERARKRLQDEREQEILNEPAIDAAEVNIKNICLRRQTTMCNCCAFIENCSERVRLSMWVACEIPSKGDVRALSRQLINGNQRPLMLLTEIYKYGTLDPQKNGHDLQEAKYMKSLINQYAIGKLKNVLYNTMVNMEMRADADTNKLLVI